MREGGRANLECPDLLGFVGNGIVVTTDALLDAGKEETSIRREDGLEPSSACQNYISATLV